MHLLLWLTACSAALPGSPLPALKLRGGGVQQTLDALPHDAKALAASFVVLGGFDKFVQHLAASPCHPEEAAVGCIAVHPGAVRLAQRPQVVRRAASSPLSDPAGATPTRRAYTRAARGRPAVRRRRG